LSTAADAIQQRLGQFDRRDLAGVQQIAGFMDGQLV